jgi:RNA polymerase sigma factor FliA
MPIDRSAAALSPGKRAPVDISRGSCDPGPAVYRSEIDETELIKRHVPTVKRSAAYLKGRLPQAVQIDDLVQAGLMAVLRIARRGDGLLMPEAMLRRAVLNAMIDEARRTTWAPTRILRLAAVAAKTMQAVRRREGREGTDEEVAAELGIPLDQYHQILVDCAGISVLDLAAFEDIAEPALQIAGDQEERLRQSRIARALASAIASLPEREKLVVSLYYEHELNMEEVGEVLGLDKSTVSRSHGRALLILRSAFADWGATADPTPHRAGD